MKYIAYNPLWKDLKRIEKTLDEKPATWEKYEHLEKGKLKILNMEIKEFKELSEKVEDLSVGAKEFYKSAKHIAAAALQLMAHIRGGADDKL